MRARVRALALALVVAGFSPAAAAAQGAPDPAPTPADEALRARVESALTHASDLPADSLEVRVVDGVVVIEGSVLCDDCGGNRTPGGSATVQQSLGAVVRAVPGVERVEFRLRYEPE
ncbi:MAG TPA: BON domain-containing protein [Longimicrobiales bacterium]|nr:BON domain-containing protein [Longimicrobiales bacterium]